MKGERDKFARYGAAVSALVFELHGRLGGDGTNLLRDLVMTIAANGSVVRLDDGEPGLIGCV